MPSVKKGASRLVPDSLNEKSFVLALATKNMADFPRWYTVPMGHLSDGQLYWEAGRQYSSVAHGPTVYKCARISTCSPLFSHHSDPPATPSDDQ